VGWSNPICRFFILVIMTKNEIEIKAVETTAELRQIKTMSDGTFNMTLNLPEYALPQVQKLMEWLKDEVKILVVQND
jgi:hypothetical protein